MTELLYCIVKTSAQVPIHTMQKRKRKKNNKRRSEKIVAFLSLSLAVNGTFKGYIFK